MQSSMKKITEVVLIQNLLKKMASDKSHIMVWQYDDFNVRVVKETQVFKFEETKQEFVLTPKGKKFNLNKEKIIYCLFDNKQMIFKSDIEFCSDFKLAISRPKEIILKETRACPRVNCIHENISIAYHFGPAIFNTHESFPFSTKLLDYSQKGMAVLSNLANITKFHIGDTVTFKMLNNNNQVVQAKIKHITQAHGLDRTEQYYRIGLGLL